MEIDGICTKPNIKDGTKIATYLFHLLSSNFIMKPRNNISSNIPDFKAIIAEAIIINNVLPNEHSFTSSFAPVIKKPTITTAGSKTARPIPQFLILNVIPKSLSFKCRRFVVYSRKSTNVRAKQPSILKIIYNSLHGNVIKEKTKSNGRLPNKSPARNSKKYTKIVVIVFDVVNLYVFFISCKSPISIPLSSYRCLQYITLSQHNLCKNQKIGKYVKKDIALFTIAKYNSTIKRHAE